MVRQQPSDIDNIFLIGTILIFLMITYNMPLATIYFAMVVIGAVMYLVPILFNYFKWIPFSKGGNLLEKIIIGGVFGLLFIQIYNAASETPMAAVFAVTIFGESVILTKLVYTFLITAVETVFFFRILLQWWAWKTGDSVRVSPFSKTGVKLMALFGGVFMLFHIIAKGIENQNDLALTILFGALSIGMILYFQELIQAVVMHIVVNAKAIGLIGSLKGIAILGNQWVILGGIALIVYYLTNKKKIRVFA